MSTPDQPADVIERADVYVRLAGDAPRDLIETTREVADGVMIDFDSGGNVVGVEVIGARTVEIDGKAAFPAPQGDTADRAEPQLEDVSADFDRTAAHSEAAADRADSGTLREQIARALEETHLGGYGKSTWELMAAEVMAVVAPLVERLHLAEAAATKFDERLSDVQAEHCKALASWDRQRGSLTAERDQLRADLAAERAAHVTTAQLGTMHSRAAEALRTKQIQLNRDLTEARRELALAAAEAEDARDGGMELALELAEARACERRLLEQREEWWRHFLGRQRQYSDMLRGMARRVGERRRDADRESKFRRASEIEMMAEVERLKESRFRWAEEAAELERQRDEAREKGHGLLDDLVREQTRANAEADVRKAIERAGDSWRATVETEATEA